MYVQHYVACYHLDAFVTLQPSSSYVSAPDYNMGSYISSAKSKTTTDADSGEGIKGIELIGKTPEKVLPAASGITMGKGDCRGLSKGLQGTKDSHDVQ